jgi:hypothetical protein
MSRGHATFRQRDLCAAIKAAKAAGCDIARVEVDRNGKIVVIIAGAANAEPTNELDQWLASRAP